MTGDKHYCISNDCPLRNTCLRSLDYWAMMERAPGWMPYSFADYYQIEGDLCGFYVRKEANKTR